MLIISKQLMKVINKNLKLKENKKKKKNKRK